MLQARKFNQYTRKKARSESAVLPQLSRSTNALAQTGRAAESRGRGRGGQAPPVVMVDLSATVSEGELRGDQRRRGRGNAPTSSTPYVPRTPLTGPGLPQMESSYGVLAALPDTSVIKFGAGFPVSGAGGLQHITWQESDASRELECLRTVVRRERLLEDVEITLRQKEQAAAVNNADVVLHGEHVVGKDSNPLIGTEGLECPPDAVIEELLKSLRELTLQVVDAIGRWQMEREVDCLRVIRFRGSADKLVSSP